MTNVRHWLLPLLFGAAQLAVWPGLPVLTGDPVEPVAGVTTVVVVLVVGVALCFRRSAPIVATAVVVVAVTPAVWAVPGDETVCLLPLDPDASAGAVRRTLAEAAGFDVPVIITDSFGRPWRDGIVNVAIGISGLRPLADYRGQADDHGMILQASVLAVADEIAAASELVMGKIARVPAAIVRGYSYQPGEGSARELQMPPHRDMFR